MDFMVMMPLGPQIMQAVAIGLLSDQYRKRMTFYVIGAGRGEGGGWMMLRTMRPAAVSCIMTAGLVISGSPHEKESV